MQAKNKRAISGMMAPLFWLSSNYGVFAAETIVSAGSNNSSETGNSGIELDLGSADKKIAAESLLKMSGTVSIMQNGASQQISSGDNITAAQYAAINQTLMTGQQSLILDANGVAIGGKLILDSGMVGRLTSLSIPNQVIVEQDFGSISSLSLVGNFTNAGSFLVTSNLSSANAIISASNIFNMAGANISSLGSNNLSISLIASGLISNLGTIASSGDLNLAAASILNGPGAVMQAAGNIAAMANTGNFFNQGLIQSLTGNLSFSNFDSTMAAINSINQTQSFIFDNTSGVLKGKNIAFSSNELAKTMSILGGDILSDVLDLTAKNATIDLNVNNLSAQMNVSASELHASANTPQMQIGNLCISGDPTFYNTGGDVVINGNLLFSGAPLAIVASGNILSANGAGSISTSSNTGNGGDILLVAGANFSSSGGPSSLPPGAGDTTSLLTITGGNISGGKIDLSQGTGVSSINSQSTAINGSGGNFRAIAYAGNVNGSGTINLASSSINTSGTSSGQDGNILILAGATSGSSITLGPSIISSSGATGGGGSIDIRTATPVITGGGGCAPCVTVVNGAITGGAFTVGTIQSNASIYTNSTSVNIQGSNVNNAPVTLDNVNFTRGFNLGSNLSVSTKSDINMGYIRTYGGGGLGFFAAVGQNGFDGGNVSLKSGLGNINVVGDINTSGGGGGAGPFFGGGAAGNGGNAGNITLTANGTVNVQGPVLAAGGGGGTLLSGAVAGGGGSLGIGGTGSVDGGGLTTGTLLGQGGGFAISNGLANNAGMPGDAKAGKAGDITLVAPDGISISKSAGVYYGNFGSAISSDFSGTAVVGHNFNAASSKSLSIAGEVALQGTQTGLQNDLDTAFNSNTSSTTVNGGISYMGYAQGAGISRNLIVHSNGTLNAANIAPKYLEFAGSAPLNLTVQSDTGSVTAGTLDGYNGGNIFVSASNGNIVLGNISSAACNTCYGQNGGSVALRAKDIQSGYIYTFGGGGQKGGVGGNGGNVALLATNGNIAVGSTGINTSGGGGGSNDPINFKAPGKGGNAGGVIIAAGSGQVSLNGPIVALGGGFGGAGMGGGSMGWGGQPNGGGLNGGTVGAGGDKFSNIGASQISGKAGDIAIGAGSIVFGQNIGSAYGIQGNAAGSPFASGILAGHNITLAGGGGINIPGGIFVQGRSDVDPTAVEYAVMLSLIIVVTITAIATLGNKPGAPLGTPGQIVPPPPGGGTVNDITVSNLLFSSNGPINIGNISFMGGSSGRNDLIISANAPSFTFGNVGVLPNYVVGMSALNVNVNNVSDITTGNIIVPGDRSFVQITTSGNINTQNITSSGGIFLSSSGNGSISAGNLNANGGTGFYNGGGWIFVDGPGGVSTGSINAYGNASTGMNSNGGSGGVIYVNSKNSSVVINGAVNSSGGGSGGTTFATGVGGDGGPITINAKTSITINGPVLSPGGGNGAFSFAASNGGGSLGIGGDSNGGGLNRATLGLGGTAGGVNAPKGTDAGSVNGGSGAAQVINAPIVNITKNVGQFYGAQANAAGSPYAPFFQYTGNIKPRPAGSTQVTIPTPPPPAPLPPAFSAESLQNITNTTITALDALQRKITFPEEIDDSKKKRVSNLGLISNLQNISSAEPASLVLRRNKEGRLLAAVDSDAEDSIVESEMLKPVSYETPYISSSKNIKPGWQNSEKGFFVQNNSDYNISSDNLISLKRGEIITDGQKDLKISTEYGDLYVGSNSHVIVNAFAGHLQIIDLSDSRHGSVKFRAGLQIVKLHPGVELCFKNKDGQLAKNELLKDGYSRRNIEVHSANNISMIISDCSIANLLSNHELLSTLRSSDKHAEIHQKISKTAAAVMQLTATKGAYSTNRVASE